MLILTLEWKNSHLIYKIYEMKFFIFEFFLSLFLFLLHDFFLLSPPSLSHYLLIFFSFSLTSFIFPPLSFYSSLDSPLCGNLKSNRRRLDFINQREKIPTLDQLKNSPLYSKMGEVYLHKAKSQYVHLIPQANQE